MRRLVPLDGGTAHDPAIVGHKAAELARATAAGLPALPGWVLPLGESAATLAHAVEVGRGRPSATSLLAASSAEIDGALRRELLSVVGSFGGSVVVRSSSPLEADPRWSGAFATYLEVGAADIEAAVRGCWASVFTNDALARAERLEADPAGIGLAVLIQPWIAFAGGGVAVVDPDGRIRISATRAAPSDLMSGRDTGLSIRLGIDDRPDEDVPQGIAPEMVHGAARMVRQVRERLGDDTIEWGWRSGSVTLLQAGRSRARVVAAPVSGFRRRRYPPVGGRLALAAASCPGPLGESWVLPWALTLEHLPPPATIEVHDVASAIREAARLSSELAVAVWDVPPDRIDAETRMSFRVIRGPEPFGELVRLSTFRPPDPVRAARLLGMIAGIGRALHARGSIPGAGHVWWLPPPDLARAASGTVSIRMGHGRWEPFVFSVARDRGRTLLGRSASPGVGAGPAVVLHGLRTVPPPRRVLAVSTAMPQLASLLWGAAGLVARTGSEGAHLFEVARSLGVPAVIGVDLDGPDDRVVAVNGDDGTVSVMEPQRSKRQARPSLERRTG